MSKILQTLSAILVLCAMALAFTAPVMAQNVDYPRQPEVSDVDKINESIPDSFFKDRDFGNRLLICANTAPLNSAGVAMMTDKLWKERQSARFTYCMRKILGEGTAEILEVLADYMRPAMYAIILFATIIMGFKAVGGMFKNTKAEVTVFLTRVAMVIFAFEHMDAISELFFDITDTLLIMLGNGAQATFVSSGSGGGAFQCQSSLGNTPFEKYEWIKIYDWLDCLFKKLFGLGTSKEAKTAFIAIAGASVFTGTSGAHLGMMFIGFFLTLGMFLLRVTTMLVMAYGAIAMMMMMFPIFLLMVFFKSTESYFFNRWLSMVVRNMVQPAIVICFMYFAVSALDILIYKGSENYFYKYDPVTCQDPDACPDPFGVEQQIQTSPVKVDDTYYQVVMPIFGILKIDPITDPIAEQAAAIKKLLVDKKKLFDMEFKFDVGSGAYKFFETQCGDMGIKSVSDAFSTISAAAWDRVKEEVTKLSPFPDTTMAQLEAGMQAPEGSDYRAWAYSVVCTTGRAIASTGPLRYKLENTINSRIPTVPVLDLSSLAEGDELPKEAHQRKVGQLVIAVFALMILGYTLYSFTNSIEALARSIVGRLGMSLSIMSNNEGQAGTLAKAIKGQVGNVETYWKGAVGKKGGKGE